MKTIEEVTVTRNTGKAFTVRTGDHIRIYGMTIVDFVAFNLHNLRERLDQARTKANDGKVFVSTGDKLYSKANNVMFTICEDTFNEGTHDLQYGMCSKERYGLVINSGKIRETYKVDLRPEELPKHGCLENLSNALAPWKIEPEDIPSPFNLYQAMKIDPERGTIEHTRILPKPGTYVDLKAEMDCLTAVSACPNPSKWTPESQEPKVIVYEED